MKCRKFQNEDHERTFCELCNFVQGSVPGSSLSLVHLNSWWLVTVNGFLLMMYKIYRCTLQCDEALERRLKDFGDLSSACRIQCHPNR